MNEAAEVGKGNDSLEKGKGTNAFCLVSVLEVKSIFRLDTMFLRVYKKSSTLQKENYT